MSKVCILQIICKRYFLSWSYIGTQVHKVLQNFIIYKYQHSYQYMYIQSRKEDLPLASVVSACMAYMNINFFYYSCNLCRHWKSGVFKDIFDAQQTNSYSKKFKRREGARPSLLQNHWQEIPVMKPYNWRHMNQGLYYYIATQYFALLHFIIARHRFYVHSILCSIYKWIYIRYVKYMENLLQRC